MTLRAPSIGCRDGCLGFASRLKVTAEPSRSRRTSRDPPKDDQDSPAPKADGLYDPATSTDACGVAVFHASTTVP